jgi:hypothetical protein
LFEVQTHGFMEAFSESVRLIKPSTPVVEKPTSEFRENESTPCREGVPATAGVKHTNKTAALAP